MKIMKKIFALAAAVSLVCLSSVGAMAANKLIVKDAGGTVDKFVVTDTGFIGIGTNAPTNPITIVGAGDPALTALFLKNTGRSVGFLPTDSPGLNFFRNNDASVNGGIPRNGDRLGYFSFGATVGGSNKFPAVVQSYAEGTWSSTSTPAYIIFATAPSGSTNAAERLRVASSGNIGIGTTAPAQKLDVSGGIRLNSTGTQPTCNAANRGTLWLIQGATDNLQICVQSGGTPIWRSITLTP